MDMAVIAQAASLESRIPFLHFFDGFRSSHEVAKVEDLTDDDLRAMIDEDLIRAHRARALSPDRPVLRGTAQNPDVFFQSREAANPFYNACPEIVQKTMDRFAELTGRKYSLFDYYGPPDAERAIVIMGSAAETVEETVSYLQGQGEKVGLLKVRLYRPFSIEHFAKALPATVRAIAVLDRTKEPGAPGEPVYLDVVSALTELTDRGEMELSVKPRVVGGRYGLSSKEFTPAMIKAVFDELGRPQPKNHFTVGIEDDVSGTSLPYDRAFSIESEDTVRAMFYGLGADGTVGANKNSVKIIGEETDNYAQGYFVYDSKKAGAITISHLRFGLRPIRAPYLIGAANFIGCHQFNFLERFDVLETAIPGATFLLNSPYGPDKVWEHLPRPVEEAILKKDLRFYVIDAYKVAHECEMGTRINTIMQTCFFAISGVLPREDAIEAIKDAIQKTYGKKGEAIVQKNFEAVDRTLENLRLVELPETATSLRAMPPVVPDGAPDFVKLVTAPIIAGKGDDLPVSAFPVDGTYPTGTTQWEKRNIAAEIPVWDPEWCIQCAKCALVCPHAAIRMKAFDDQDLQGAPETFLSMNWKGKEFENKKMTIQTAPEDCTGCGLCVVVCPAKNKKETRLKAINMVPKEDVLEAERANYDFFLSIPELDRRTVKIDNVKGSQLLQPLFEYSGACAGCGETPYVKLMTQLFGDRMLISNATGCSSIYGGNLPTTPYTKNPEGRGPTWSNSLFEDNAEFGFGYRLTLDKHLDQARELVQSLRVRIGEPLADLLLTNPQVDESDIHDQRERVEALKEKLNGDNSPEAKRLLSLADFLVKKSVWILGGDGWAYDIGYGGLDHVLASGRNVNILVLDTEVYSNTGGQSSKATPRGAVAKFAAAGKPTKKKDLGMMAMNYGGVYVAQVAMGANDAQTVRAFIEAERHPGPSLIIAYSHCIAHGIVMSRGLESQKRAVESGHWILYRYDPARAEQGENPLQLDSRAPKLRIEDYIYQETRYKMLTKSDPERAKRLLDLAQGDATERWELYHRLAKARNGQEAH
jgi:pyruvate-ferredoxin/flavodoxin oxidoreductase